MIEAFSKLTSLKLQEELSHEWHLKQRDQN